MTVIKCYIVDDEPPAIELLSKYIDMIDHLEVVGTSHSAVKAFDRIDSQQIDLMFLDIQMPVLNGIDLLRTLKYPPSTILTTAYRDYALDGFDLDIVDYLLKPIAFDRFLKSVDRYKRRIANIPHSIKKNDQEDVVDHIFVNVNRTQHKVVMSEILYVESLKDYVRIHMIRESLIVKGNIGSFLKLLPRNGFIRIHRSYVVSKTYIQSYNQSEVNVSGTKLPVGVSYRAKLSGLIS